ncbi:MAG: Unknown protein [uncultured Sulfurovum sp.]|uniref:Indole-3-glycerol-phosphate synthase n=1 Tax=uncultured Sulfurovum sp. TaxID=269237 RepID=A0A6S6TG52_9BACT|nr:MAG: Unknown protein [uncultured Sulfurovum sp.]
MIIIGHQWVESPKFHKVYTQAEIEKCATNEIALLEPLNQTHDQAKYCQDNAIPYAVIANTITDAVFANALGATYIVCKYDDATMLHPIAQEYLFDTNILVLLQECNTKEITKVARSGIDGIIFPEAIIS